MMAKQITKKSANDKLKQQLAEQAKAMEALRNEMAEKQKEFETRLEDEVKARREEKTRMEGMDVGGEDEVYISDVSSKSIIEHKQLNDGQTVNCRLYVVQSIFPEVKFVDDDIFKESPRILEETMKKIEIFGDREIQQHIEDTKRVIKYALQHKRSYCKLQHAIKYKGKKRKLKPNQFLNVLPSNTK